MVVNKKSDSQKSNRSVLKKYNVFQPIGGMSGRDIPKLENIIKRQRQRAQSIAKQLLDRKTTSGGRIGKMKQKEMLEEQRDNNVRAFENEKVLIKLKARLLNIKRDKKGPKKLTLSDYNIDVLLGDDTKSQSKIDSFKLNIKDFPKKNKLIDERKRRIKVINGLITKDVESLRICAKKHDDQRFMSTRSDSTKTTSSEKLNIIKSKTSSSDEIENLNINVSSDKDKFPKKKVSPKKKEKFVKKVLPKRKEKLIKEIKSINSGKKEKELLIKKRKIFLDRLSKLNLGSLKKCLVQNVIKPKDDSDSIDKMLDKLTKKISKYNGSSSGKPSFEPDMMNWATNMAQDFVMKNRNDNVKKMRPIWDNELPTYEMSQEARNLLNNPPKHFLYGKKEKIVIPKSNSWSDQVDVFRVIHTNRIPLDLIKPTGKIEIAYANVSPTGIGHIGWGFLPRSEPVRSRGDRPSPNKSSNSKTKRKVMVPMVTKDDVIRAYKDNYYVNITSVFTRREIKFKDSKAQHYAYDNKIDVSLLYPISYLKNRLNFKKKKPTNAQANKLKEQMKKLLERWNKTGITLIDLQGHVNNKPMYKLTEIEELLRTVKNIGRGKQNVKQQKILEKQIKKELIKLKNKDLVGEKKDLKEFLKRKKKKSKTESISSVSSGQSVAGEENVIEELLNTDRMSSNNSVKMQDKKVQNIRDFKLLKEALVILREKMAFVPIISPKNRNILEPWDI